MLLNSIPRELDSVVAKLKAGAEVSLAELKLADPSELSAFVFMRDMPATDVLGDLEPWVAERLGIRDLVPNVIVVSLTRRESPWLRVVLLGQETVERLANHQGLPSPVDLGYYAACLATSVVVSGNSALIEYRRPQEWTMYAAIRMGMELRPRLVERVGPEDPGYALLAWLSDQDARAVSSKRAKRRVAEIHGVVDELKAGFVESLAELGFAETWLDTGFAQYYAEEVLDDEELESLGVKNVDGLDCYMVRLTYRGSTWSRVFLLGQGTIGQLASCWGLPCPRDLAFHTARVAEKVVVFRNRALLLSRFPQPDIVCAGIQLGAQLQPQRVVRPFPERPRYVWMDWSPSEPWPPEPDAR